MPTAPKHVFVLMLENRSFDHLLGFSGLEGVDATTGESTRIDGLTGEESNDYEGVTYRVVRGAEDSMPSDPGHEFTDVLRQLCGTSARYAPPYPRIDRSGFVASYAMTGGGADPGAIMRCFDTSRQLPVLHALASEFAVCDRWFASIPGSTWPNRMFAHAASSGGLDHSPSVSEIVEWETVAGFAFPRGTVFQALARKGVSYHLYSGDDFPMVAGLKGITLADVHRIEELVEDLKKQPFPHRYVFIEPSYDFLRDYRHGSCQHPLADVHAGEALIKTVYEAIRSSPVWEDSLLVVTWDEHGGFYDHVTPTPAVAPGDAGPGSRYNQFGFTFERHGVRVPAVVVSPRIPRGTIDHREYDHASIPATLRATFGIDALTERDRAANHVLPLLSLDAPRACPATLPAPASSPPVFAAVAAPGAVAAAGAPPPVARPADPVDGAMLPAFVHAAMCADLERSPERRAEILARVSSLQTRQDAMTYLQDVQGRLRV